MFRHLSITLIGQVVVTVLSLLAGIMAARLLGPVARGELATLMLLPMTLQVLAAAGLSQALVVLTARMPRKAGGLTATVAGLVALSSLLSVVIGLVALPFLLSNVPQPLQQQAGWVLACLLPLLALFGLPSNTLLGFKQYFWFQITRIGGGLLYLLAVLGAFVHASAAQVAWGYVALLACVGLPFTVWLYRHAVRQPFCWDSSLLAPLRRFALPNFLSQLPQVLGQRLDQFVVVAVLSTTALGYYTIALAVSQLVLAVLQNVGSILMPYIAGEDTATQRTALFGRTIRLTALASLAAAAGAAVVLPWLVPLLFGSAFEAAVGPARWLVLAYALYGLHYAFMDGFRGYQMLRFPLLAEALHLAAKAALFGGTIALAGLDDLDTIALLTLLAVLVPLAFDVVAYHRTIEPVTLRWFGETVRDVQAVWVRFMLMWRSRVRRG